MDAEKIGWCEDEIGPPEGLHPAGKERYVSDRLWVGPERQAWLEGQAEGRRTWPGWRSFCWYEADGDPEAVREFDVVLGIDGRWRWTLDLGIEPR